MGTLATRLKEIRNLRKLTQEELAKLLNTNRGTLANWENDRTEPDADTIRKIAETLGVSTDYLLGLTDDPTDPNEAARKTITEALEGDDELLEFWKELQEREDLQIFFKQVKSLSPRTIRRVMKYIKMVEDEEANEE